LASRKGEASFLGSHLGEFRGGIQLTMGDRISRVGVNTSTCPPPWYIVTWPNTQNREGGIMRGRHGEGNGGIEGQARGPVGEPDRYTAQPFSLSTAVARRRVGPRDRRPCGFLEPHPQRLQWSV